MKISSKLTVFLSYLIILITNSYGTVYYAGPKGIGDGKTIKNPFMIEDFWSHAKPGDTLMLLDGIYTGRRSMIKPLSEQSGTLNNYIVIKALNEGKVLINGQSANKPVQLERKNCYFIIEGINADSGNYRDVISIDGGSNYNQIKRVCAWDAIDDNSAIFGVHYSSHTLFEDCAGWGTARKIYSNSQEGNYTTYRRCFGRWERSALSSPKMVYTAAYNSGNNLFENCIGTWDADYKVTNGNTYGMFALDHMDTTLNLNAKWLGCISYLVPGQRCDGFDDGNSNGGLFNFVAWSGNRYANMTIENCIAFVDTNFKNIRCFDLRKGTAPLKASYCTAIGGSGVRIETSVWDTSNFYISKNASDLIASNGSILQSKIKGVQRGANVVKRYLNGKLTDQDLWPWPMNQRIIDAMKTSGHTPVIDVTAEILGLGGAKFQTGELNIKKEGLVKKYLNKATMTLTPIIGIGKQMVIRRKDEKTNMYDLTGKELKGNLKIELEE